MQALQTVAASTTSSRSLAALAGLLLCFAPAASWADKRGKTPQPEDVLPESDFDDPIGVDSESRAVERTAVEAQQKAAALRAPPADHARYGPEPPALDVRQGEVLTAGPSTREVAHSVNVELEPGLASVHVEMRFESRGQKPSELRYRLAVPEGSALAALEVCNAHGCRRGLPERSAGAQGAYDAALLARGGEHPLPIAQASNVHDARGDAIVVRAAPVAEGQPLTVRVSYVGAAPLHGGVLRLTLPARGMDPEAAESVVKLSAPRLLDARIGGAPASDTGAGFDPWLEVPIRARARSAEPLHASAWHFPCGKQGCAWTQLWAGPRAAAPVDLLIALDVSPSTEGPARGRLLATISALLAAAPEGSRVRALAFAARARPLIEQPMEPSQVVLAPFSQAIAKSELGSATRFEAVWELARSWLKKPKHGLRPLLAIVGDGGLTVGDARPFDRAHAEGVEVSSVNAADRPTSNALFSRVLRAGGIAIDAGAEAEAAARGRDASQLGERLAALFAPTLAARVSVGVDGRRIDLGPLRAGEQLDWQGIARSPIALRYGAGSTQSQAPAERQRSTAAALAVGALRAAGKDDARLALAAVDARDLDLAGNDWPEQPSKGRCDRRGPAHRRSGVSADALPVALAEERACKKAPKTQVRSGSGAEIGTGMPSDPLLSMLRQRIMPVARGCFRRDRAGRPDYTTRATFVFTLAEREVVDARVEGKIPDALRTCLLAAVDTLEVPRFSGVVNVRYPLITESMPLPEQIDLRAGTAGTLDRLFGTAEAR